QYVLKAAAPAETQFGIDVNDCHTRFDRLLRIFVAGSGTTVERHEDTSRRFNLGNSLDIQTLLGLTVNHTLQQPMHISDSRRKHINPGRVDELLYFFRS